MTITIRKATVDDATSLFKLNELFNGTGTTTIEQLTNSLKNNNQEIIFVAIIDDIIVGFICGQIFKSMCYSTYYGEISELFVQEEYRRMGIAKRLISNMEDEFKRNNIFSFQLFTGEKNTTAQALYCSCGYIRSNEFMYRKRVAI